MYNDNLIASPEHFEDEIFRFYDGLCAYCRTRIHQYKSPNATKFNIEHMQPISQGGCSGITNCLPSCKKCNNLKGVSLFSEWLEQLPDDTAAELEQEYMQRFGAPAESFVPTELTFSRWDGVIWPSEGDIDSFESLTLVTLKQAYFCSREQAYMTCMMLDHRNSPPDELMLYDDTKAEVLRYELLSDTLSRDLKSQYGF
jgi:hypothetical protein